MYDKVIRGGTIVDGSGAPRYTADLAILDGKIAEIGKIAGRGREEIDADGLVVAPGWVDVHSHYDGQVTWDDQLSPSCWHGVTTAMMGNCGVGFAPVKADKRDWLIGLMEGVEDIPGHALAEGIKWEWETFPDYMAALGRRALALDVGAQLTHGALRVWVMGERGAHQEAARPEDLAEMARQVREAQSLGAWGFSTSRTVVHRAMDGEPVPGTFAAVEEIYAFAQALADSGHGVLEVAPAGLLGEDIVAPAKELAWMNEVSAKTGCPITFLTGQNHVKPTWWRDQLAECVRQRRNHALVVPQMFCRAIGIMVCLEGKAHPFINAPTWKALSDLPYAVRVQRLQADPDLRRQMALEGVNDVLGGTSGFSQWAGSYALGYPADYEPDPKNSIRNLAKRQGRDAREVALDILLEDGGRGFIHRPVMGYADGNLDPTYELLASPYTVPGGADGGAHVQVICDAGSPTFMLTHWVRDRSRGPRLGLEHIVRKQTHDAAQLYGMNDRGLLRPGLRADVNLIDFDNLDVGKLHMVHDLPTGSARLMQKAKGYVATFVAGVQTIAQGEDTGARPGRLARSVQPPA